MSIARIVSNFYILLAEHGRHWWLDNRWLEIFKGFQTVEFIRARRAIVAFIETSDSLRADALTKLVRDFLNFIKTVRVR
jgi:hypothetical protein